eukprot:scaffold50558_cov30-Tisochrysis_lutea.AAC.18
MDHDSARTSPEDILFQRSGSGTTLQLASHYYILKSIIPALDRVFAPIGVDVRRYLRCCSHRMLTLDGDVTHVLSPATAGGMYTTCGEHSVPPSSEFPLTAPNTEEQYNNTSPPRRAYSAMPLAGSSCATAVLRRGRLRPSPSSHGSERSKGVRHASSDTAWNAQASMSARSSAYRLIAPLSTQGCGSALKLPPRAPTPRQALIK